MGCWLQKDTEEQQEQKQNQQDKPATSQEEGKQADLNQKECEDNQQAFPQQPIPSQNFQIQTKVKRKSYLGGLLSSAKTKNSQTRFTKKQKQHIAFAWQQKTQNHQNAIRIILEDKLDSVRQFIEQNGQSLTSCSICTLPYNLQERQPKMLCMNQHTLCSECVDELWSKGIKKCPFDKKQFDINTVRKNRILIQFMQQEKSRKQQ